MPIVLKSGTLNLLEPLGPVQAYNGIALLLSLRVISRFDVGESGCFCVDFPLWVEKIAERIWSFAGVHEFSKESSSHPKITDPRYVTGSKFRTVDLQMLGASVQNSLALATWLMGFCPPLVLSWGRQNSELLFGSC